MMVPYLSYSTQNHLESVGIHNKHLLEVIPGLDCWLSEYHIQEHFQMLLHIQACSVMVPYVILEHCDGFTFSLWEYIVATVFESFMLTHDKVETSIVNDIQFFFITRH